MPSPKTVSFFGFDELVRVPSDYLDAAPPVAEETPRARMNEGTLVTGIALDHVCSRGDPARGPSSEPGQRRNGLSPVRRGRSAVRFRPLHQNKNLRVRSRSSLV